MSDKIKEIQDKFFKNINNGGDQLVAAAAYIPIVGWIYPYYYKKTDELCQFHGRQGALLNGAMLAIYFAIWLLEHFPLTSWLFGDGSVFYPISRSIWLVTAAVYALISIFCALKAISEEKWEVPYLEEVVNRLKDKVRGK